MAQIISKDESKTAGVVLLGDFTKKTRKFTTADVIYFWQRYSLTGRESYIPRSPVSHQDSFDTYPTLTVCPHYMDWKVNFWDEVTFLH